MTRPTDYEVFKTSSDEHMRLLRQEELILEVTEALAEALEREGITKVELAQRLHKSKGFVSQVFAGGRNLTLRTIADVADAFNCRVRVHLEHERHPAEMPERLIMPLEVESSSPQPYRIVRHRLPARFRSMPRERLAA
jgi:transcriptional regulator with XRE-family HTH domain